MTNNFDSLLALAIAEDLGTNGDVTSDTIFQGERGSAFIMCRQNACLAGIDYAKQVFNYIDSDIIVTKKATDGDQISVGQEIMTLEGSVASLLRGERIALNFMAYLSGIATETRRHVEIARAAGSTLILDTRKTLPGYRQLAKEAVLCGGGRNHRMGLHDMVLIKDNHIDAAGGIAAAVGRVRIVQGDKFRIEVECRNLDEVRTALSLSVDVIMLDNMDARDCLDAIELRKSQFAGSATLFEASGDMNPDKLARFAGLGLDYISIGRLTHSVSAVNFSMQIRR